MSESRGWRVAAASTIGTSHAKLGLPCQDARGVKLLSDKDGEDVLVVVVSDGAGSASKANIGSWRTCSTIVKAAEDYLHDGRKVADIDRNIAKLWIQMVQQAIGNQAEDDGGVPRDYACTMLVAVVGQDAAAFMQIGDGAIVISAEDGWGCMCWPQHGEFANVTFFVTEHGAEGRLAFDLCKRRIDEIAVFTDGIERLVLHEATKTAFAPFFDRMFPAVRALESEGLDLKLSESLEGYLNSKIICDKTDDDKSLVLATRRAPILAPAEAITASGQET